MNGTLTATIIYIITFIIQAVMYYREKDKNKKLHMELAEKELVEKEYIEDAICEHKALNSEIDSKLSMIQALKDDITLAKKKIEELENKLIDNYKDAEILVRNFEKERYKFYYYSTQEAENIKKHYNRKFGYHIRKYVLVNDKWEEYTTAIREIDIDVPHYSDSKIVGEGICDEQSMTYSALGIDISGKEQYNTWITTRKEYLKQALPTQEEKCSIGKK